MKPEDKARHKETYDFLNNVGCGFCLAKWTQVTIHLASGITHSCHHVGAHTIPLDELEKDPGALHNTSEKKQRRKEMLAGQRPAECDYCWRIEDNTNEYSDRILKSSNEWSQVDKDKIAKSTGDENFYPRSVEVSFSNVCNFKCSYCGPPFSSKWAEEIKQQGPYKLSYIPYNTIKPSEIPIPEREHNPYIEAFWKWFPDAVTYMHVFRITGGEPLLSKHTFKVIDYLLENPQPQLGFAINSNACPPGELWDKFISKIQQLEKAKAVKYFTLYTSAESFGEQAEYSRDGMDWELFTKNIDQILSATDNVKVVFMSAFNILSLPSLRGYLRYTNNLKRKFQPQRISLDFAYVRHPQFLDIKVATPELIDKYLKSCIDYMVEHRNAGGRRFFETEIYKLNRIYQDCMTRFEKGENVDKDRKRFSEFVEEYDKRRNKSFVKTFPEFKQFLAFCKGK
jgi:organic radical activating enzyme